MPGILRIAGTKEFVSETQRTLASSAIGRNVRERIGMCELGEPSISYSDHFAPEKYVLRSENTYLWNISDDISGS